MFATDTPAPADEKSLIVLEWPRLQEALLGLCASPYGQLSWQNTPFLPDTATVRLHLDEVATLQRLLQRFGMQAVDKKVPWVTPLLERLEKGGLFTVHDLCQLATTLRAARSIVGYVLNHLPASLGDKSLLEERFLWLTGAYLPSTAMEKLESWLDVDRHQFADSASLELAELRHKMQRQTRSLHETAEDLLRSETWQAALQSANYSERDGRLVLPVKAGFKNTVPGVVLGSSATGATVFIEPRPLQEWNNRLLQTEAAIRQEEQRLLRLLCAELQPQAEVLLGYLDAFAELDRRLAAAQLSIRLDAQVPNLRTENEASFFHWEKARHPLLVLQPPEGGVVANTLSLGVAGVRTLVITGPNTGGKTVLLKTIGLLALMVQAGLPVPVGEGSSCSLTRAVFAELGDAQDLAQNLSTFSGHLLRLNQILQENSATRWSHGLILIDEIVAGTDPVEGSALARALLERFHQMGALTVLTTHLGDLKLEAHQQEGYQNASTVFDPDTLKPTYRLYAGIPGSSHAIAIAERLGLPGSLTQRAKALMGSSALEAGTLLAELETNRTQAEQDRLLASSLREQLEAEWQELKAQQERFRQSKQMELEQFRAGMRRRVRDLDKQLKQLRKRVRSQEAALDEAEQAAQLASSQLRHLEGALETELEATELELAAQAPMLEESADFAVGATVFSVRLNGKATVLERQNKGKRYVIEAGPIKLTVDRDDLTPVHSISTEEAQRNKQAELKRLKRLTGGKFMHRPLKAASNTNDYENTKPARKSRLECDVRGMRAAEALEEVERFLDEAIGSGFEVVGIIHGLGTGALKKAIRQALKQHKHVKNYYPEQAFLGGDGKTIVEL